MDTVKFLLDEFDNNADQTAIAQGTAMVTYGELSANLRYRIDWLIDKGVQRGDVAILLGDYSLEAVSIFLALTELGCILVPLTPAVFESLTDESIHEIAPMWKINATLDVVAIEQYSQDNIVRPKLYDILEAAAAPGLVMFTSGSSGKPKAVVHDFAKLLNKFKTPRPSMITLNFLLFDHWGGLNTLLHCLSNTCLIVFPDGRTPQSVCALVEKHRIELLPATPSFLNLLMISKAYADYDLSSIKLISYGAEPMAETTLQTLVKVFPQVELRQTYGMIELGVLRAKTRSFDSLWVKVGGPGYELRVVNNILQIKAESAMLGYINAPSPFTEDGYLITGDLVEQDGEWLHILGRQSDLINVGGQKVYPSEVEAVILDHEAVQDVVVFGSSHALTGKIVCADIILQSDSNQTESRKSITKFARSRLQEYMVPMKIRFVEGSLQNLRLKRIRSEKQN